MSELLQRPVVILVICLLMVSTTAGDGSDNSSGGPAILIEEKTATWCSPCAEFDPLLADFIVDVGGRAILAAHHPNDGVDSMGSSASAHRLSRLGATNSTVTPTVWFDAGVGVQGPLTRSDLVRHVSAAEGDRPTSSRLSIIPGATSLEATGIIVNLDSTGVDLSNTTLTIMLVETAVARPVGSVTGDALEVVTRGITEINLSTSSTLVDLPTGKWVVDGEIENGFVISSALDSSWQINTLGWIVVHERVEDGKVVEILGVHASLPDIAEDGQLNSRWMVVAGILVMVVGARIWHR